MMSEQTVDKNVACFFQERSTFLFVTATGFGLFCVGPPPGQTLHFSGSTSLPVV